MIRAICKDEAFLAQPAEPATTEDMPVAQDLLDTLAAHKDGCVGMAANMIGVNKRIIVFDNKGRSTVMFNPRIVKKLDPYEAEEGCLSLSGRRKVERWRQIRVEYLNAEFKPRVNTYTGWTAEIIQHEVDHCDGALV